MITNYTVLYSVRIIAHIKIYQCSLCLGEHVCVTLTKGKMLMWFMCRCVHVCVCARACVYACVRCVCVAVECAYMCAYVETHP